MARKKSRSINSEDIGKSALQLHREGRLDQAEILYRKWLKQDPNADVAYNNLGYILLQQRRLDAATSCFRKAIEINSNFAMAYNNLGIALAASGQFGSAMDCYLKAIGITPSYAEAWNNMGNAFQDMGNLDKAFQCYEKALLFNPHLPDAYNNLGLILQTRGRFDEAISYYRKALSINPSLADVYNNLGNTLNSKGNREEAIRCYEKASHFNPYHAEACYNAGNLLSECGRNEEAISSFNKALSIRPNYISALWSRCMSSLPILYADEEEMTSARSRYSSELQRLKDKISLNTAAGMEAAAKAVGGHQPFYLAYQGKCDRDLQSTYGGLVCKIMAARYPRQSTQRASLCDGEKLRIGIVCGYFFHHSVWKIPVKGWVENIDHDRFELYGYHTGRKKDRETEAARQCFTKFTEDVYSFEELCRTIQDDNLHAIIYPEIGMNPAAARLAALRLAPVQCASWGHPDTSGFPTIDYYLSSDLMESETSDSHYTEQLVRLPNLSVSYVPLEVPQAEETRITLGLPENDLLYLCCQSLFKYLPQYDDVYPRIAKETGECRFVFISHRSSFVTEKFVRRLQKAFARHGMNAEDYIIVLPFLEPAKYNALNSLADVYLDSLGWSGANTTFEAIAHNLPVVTLPGEFMRARHTAAILTMMGLRGTIASSLEEYVSLAVRLGVDAHWRREIAQKTAERKHHIYGDMECISALEKFLEAAVKEKTGPAQE